MISTLALTRYLNKVLDHKHPEPYSKKNGMQVSSKKTVSKIGLAVDACSTVFSEAKRRGCDMIIVHHGILWKGQRDSFGLTRRYISFLKKGRISLFASHLPLDGHPKIGNNAQIAAALGFLDPQRFCDHGIVAHAGRLQLDTIISKVKTHINPDPICLPFGKKKIRTAVISSGGGSSYLKEAYHAGHDLLITGEGPHHIHHLSKDLSFNVILAGHYHTETFGVIALGELIKDKFKIPTTFIDIPTKV